MLIWPPINAVFDDIDSLGTVERIYCLGDVIGYGPEPVEALEKTIERCSLILMGNHESAVVSGALASASRPDVLSVDSR